MSVGAPCRGGYNRVEVAVPSRSCVSSLVLALAATAASLRAQTAPAPAPKPATPNPSAAGTPSRSKSTTAAGSSASRSAQAETFDSLVAKAAAARDANRTAEAIRLYQRAVALRPDWDEGVWWQGALLYESKKYDEARRAFTRFLELKNASGPGFVMRGLCAFQAKDWPAAAEDLSQGLGLGLGGNSELLRAARFSLGVAQTKDGQFVLALQPLSLLARTQPETPATLDAIGLAMLQMPMTPDEIPEPRREFVRRVGQAGYLDLRLKRDEAAKAYADLVRTYPDAPGVHYAYGVFLMAAEPEKGLAELRRETELKPDNVLAWLQIAFELLQRGDYPSAKEAAAKAVALAPSLFAAHNAYGRALVELGDLESGIPELEEAARLAPESPEMQFALARAYAKAGRTEDSNRARAAFATLDRKRREKRTGGARGGVASEPETAQP
jgi:tetratricopeptide (TPR) repeat protein